jgi:hypothetical protein
MNVVGTFSELLDGVGGIECIIEHTSVEEYLSLRSYLG